MKFTCLSKGRGYHYPPCHVLDTCGCRVLVDCPLDLSALAIFSPVPTKISDKRPFSVDSEGPEKKGLDGPLYPDDLIVAEPWYKTVSNLHLWNVSFFDVVLITSPMGMLGLPFLTQNENFSAKIYVTEAASRIGQLMMEDLVSLHGDFKQFYGPEESSFPQWMKWEKLESLPSALREVALGKDGTELGGWMPLYSAADVKDCIKKIHNLKYAEEACYNGTLVMKAFSSGLEIGACNWLITGPKGNIGFLSSSIFDSTCAMNFNYHALQGSDLILYSDFSFMSASGDFKDGDTFPILSNESCSSEALDNILLSNDDNLEEMQKLAYISSLVVESVEAGGSVLITIGRVGVVLQLLESISVTLESSNVKVPMFLVSSVAEELLALMNTIPEWLCTQRQNKLFSGEPLYVHVELMKENKLHVFPTLYSHKLLMMWQEPCIVFSPHWSLRLGPAIHLLRRWCRDQNSLLVMEDGVDVDLTLLPFKPIAMNVCQCSFLSGIKLNKIKNLVEKLLPRSILMPDEVKQQIVASKESPVSLLHYSENESLRVLRLKDHYEVHVAKELVSQFQWRRLEDERKCITRLKGEVFADHGKFWLGSGNQEADTSSKRPLLQWGCLSLDRLMALLQEKGIEGSVDEDITSRNGSGVTSIVRIHDPKKALIEIRPTSTAISADDDELASLISEVVDSLLKNI